MPQVTSTPERETKPRRTGAQNAVQDAQAVRARYGKRPFVRAEDGWPAPTALEIEEGAAHKIAFENPKSKLLMAEWSALYLKLITDEGGPCTSRCLDCHVVLYGRGLNVPCGHCGGKGVWRDTVRRWGE